MDTLIELKSVSAGYDGKEILQDVNLKIMGNDFLGIIGPNGGGKTTLLRVILGLLKPGKGEIIYNKNLSSRGSLGYLPQFSVIDRDFPITAADVVLSGLAGGQGITGNVTKKNRARAEEIMNRFGISDIQARTMGKLSGGQMQRVFLCRALISSPEVLILDEPDTFVDSVFSRDLNDILIELNNTMTIILVSHDIGTIISSVKNIACVNSTLHYHSSDEFSQELLEKYNCPVHIIGHGDVPHTVLKKHECHDD